MNIVFFGNTKYSLIGAKIIHEKLGIANIVTIPDRPDKRGHLQESPLKTFGKENNIPVLEVNTISDETIAQIKSYNADFFIVEDYGLILPSALLDLPKKAALNIHHSLLPKYRGSSPAPAAILHGDKTTGVSVIMMTDKLDAGDILGQTKYEIKSDDTTESLLTELNKLGSELIVSILNNFDEAKIKAKKQHETQVTITKLITKNDGLIDTTNPPSAEKLDRMIRAYYPWPTVWTLLRFSASHSVKTSRDTSEGQARQKRIIFLPGKMIQVEGKNPMSVKDFMNGYPELKQEIEKLLSLNS